MLKPLSTRKMGLTLTLLTSAMEGGRLLTNLFRDAEMLAVPGATETLLYSFCQSYLKTRGSIANPIISINTNEYAFHGYRRDVIFRSGDIVTLDIAFRYKSSWVDMAWSYLIGLPSAEVRNLYESAKNAVDTALREVWPGEEISALSGSVESQVKRCGCHIIPEACGHGVGRELHEKPLIPFARSKDSASKARFPQAGIVTIEPVLTLGSGKLNTDPVSGCFKTADRKPAAYFETMVFLSPLGKETPFWKIGK